MAKQFSLEELHCGPVGGAKIGVKMILLKDKSHLDFMLLFSVIMVQTKRLYFKATYIHLRFGVALGGNK